MYSDNSNDGCLLWIIFGVALLLGMVIMGAGGDVTKTNTTTTTTTNSTSVLSNNELLSRNQLNLFSTVNNYFGANSGQTTNSTNTTTNSASGERSQITTDSAGNPMCWSEQTHMYIYSPCPQVKP